MSHKILKKVSNIIFLIFIMATILLFAVYSIESFTYYGFVKKHFYINSDILLNAVIINAAVTLAMLFKFDKYVADINEVIKKNMKLSILISGAISFLILTLNLVETLTYSNYIYSHMHIQPKLLMKCIYLLIGANVFFASIYLKDINLNRLVASRKIISFLNDLFEIVTNKKALKVTTLTLRIVVLFAYSVAFAILVVKNTLVFLPNFYKVDTTWRQENELKYFLGKITIFQWINDYLPETKDIISWCDMQTSSVEIISLDPKIIWLDSEGLSRVFLTNCYYGNMPSISKSFQYLDSRNLLLTSVSKCDSDMVDTKPDPGIKIMEFFKILNNRFVCESEEVVTNLYKFTK